MISSHLISSHQIGSTLAKRTLDWRRALVAALTSRRSGFDSTGSPVFALVQLDEEDDAAEERGQVLGVPLEDQEGLRVVHAVQHLPVRPLCPASPPSKRTLPLRSAVFIVHCTQYCTVLCCTVRVQYSTYMYCTSIVWMCPYS